MGYFVKQIRNLYAKGVNAKNDEHYRNELFDSLVSILEKVMYDSYQLFSSNLIIDTSKSNGNHFYANFQLLFLRLLLVHGLANLLEILLHLKKVACKDIRAELQNALHHNGRWMINRS